MRRPFLLEVIAPLAVSLAGTVAAAPVAAAQAYNYPAFQPPVLAEREYNFAAASAGHAGTSLLAQWREGVSPRFQFSFDGGLAAPEGRGADTRVLLGGAFAWQVARADSTFPFDAALTAGVGFSTGNSNSVVRVPVGVALGHRFTLEGGYTLTPFVHPRLSLDRCSACRAGGSDGKVNVDVDVGAAFAVNDQLTLRVAALLGGADFLGATNAVGLAVAWTPRGLRK